MADAPPGPTGPIGNPGGQGARSSFAGYAHARYAVSHRLPTALLRAKLIGRATRRKLR
jgi:hypothetical protein